MNYDGNDGARRFWVDGTVEGSDSGAIGEGKMALRFLEANRSAYTLHN